MKAALAMTKKALANVAVGNATCIELMDASAKAGDGTDGISSAVTKALMSTRMSHVKAGLEKIEKCLEEDEVIFKKWVLPATDKFKYNKTYAHVRAGEKENQIYLGGAFWVAKTKGIDSKAGTVVHELSHRLHGTKDHHYGLAKSKQSAIDTPWKATTNADNYERFAERP